MAEHEDLPPRSRVERGVGDLDELAAVRGALASEGVGQGWLVGGALRDLALARDVLDLDLALPGDGRGVALRLAAALGGTAFPLDEAEGAWRVARRGGRTVDCVPLRAASLEEDLRGRDFTVNALAFDLLGEGGVRDPLGGLGDLAAGLLRPCSPRALIDDPVRVLRTYRFAVSLGFRPVPEVRPLLGTAAPGLGRVAPERVRTEFFAVLGLAGGERALRAMEADGVLRALFPFVGGWPGFDQGDYHSYDLLEHSLRAAEWAGRLAAEPEGLPRPDALRAHLSVELEAGVSRRALLVCAALLHDVAKPRTRTLDGDRRRFLGHEVAGGADVAKILAGLRLGRRSRRAGQRLVAAHLRLFQLAHQDPPTRRARLRYLKDLGGEVPEALLLGLADERATGPRPPAWDAVRRTAAEVLALYWRRREARPVEPLLRGRDLVEMGLPEGPEVGEVLRRVEEAEASGRVSSRREAVGLARELIAGRGSPG